jgi:hypothetical protein
MSQMSHLNIHDRKIKKKATRRSLKNIILYNISPVWLNTIIKITKTRCIIKRPTCLQIRRNKRKKARRMINRISSHFPIYSQRVQRIISQKEAKKKYKSIPKQAQFIDREIY